MKTRPFQQLDVFSAVPYRGNALAVVLNAEGIDDAAMQAFARWTHLSETTFLLPPTDAGRSAGADYRVRIFTPGRELPFAGHPTLGSCHAWLRAGGQPTVEGKVVQECGVGLVTLRRNGERLAFAAPPLKRSEPAPALLAGVLAALGIDAAQLRASQMLDNGPVTLGLLLDDIETVLALQPDHGALKALGTIVGVAARPGAAPEKALIGRSNREARAFSGGTSKSTADQNTVALEVRVFAAADGIEEDPVTGSVQAALAQWLIAEGHLPPHYLAGQGQAMGRDGFVHVERDADGAVWIGGDSVCCIEGQVTL